MTRPGSAPTVRNGSTIGLSRPARELGDLISRELAVVTDKLAEQERRAGRQQ
jgi:hypothetical protein